MKFPQFFKSRTIALIAVLIAVRALVADWYLVPTGSMNPTIQDGDFIFVNKLAYGARLPFTNIQLLSGKQPVRGDVVVFIKAADNTRMVKRLIGVPGDTVQLKDNVLWLNGVPAQYFLIESTGDKFIVREQIDSLDHDMQMLVRAKSTKSNTDTMVVPAGKYLVMGDNRDKSFDSRFFGFVDQTDLVGRAEIVLASFAPDTYMLRMNRMGQSL
ncbi:TPA: signal peptidase I [Pseudomonas aeruginosa]|uniref:signal peptidase I n=1 Tax=Pseudomonas aeruginosa TaxID=287 RepID=UPI00093AC525|nr:signal peptidase I [Pseudomonas aeruginosa]EKF7416660.1 signal peptidase I [Pseudomonas aeruginosa]CAI9794667.1 signal peptidase I [Pseudomonas aeruginosa]CAI9912056.1 signal peptidase I [Pseudomonas aeruginosa]HBO1617680.1 signal peptidase I [Pseudomonas aeruginosa]HBO9385180.1 signal peptidase I [Pseudomonas aeruginosa]